MESNFDRLKLAITATLMICDPKASNPAAAADELVRELAHELAEPGADPLLRPKSESSRALVQVPRSRLSQAEFQDVYFGGKYKLKFNTAEVGLGMTVDPTSGSVSTAGSLHALGVKGEPIGTPGRYSLTYHGRGVIRGIEKPAYDLSLDGSYGFPVVSVWLAIQASHIKEWVGSEYFYGPGIGIPPIFIKLGKKNFLLFEVGGLFGNWKHSGVDSNGKSHVSLAYGGVSHLDLRLGDFLLTVGGHFHKTANIKEGPLRYDVNASVSIPLDWLLSNEAIRIEFSRLAVFGSTFRPDDSERSDPWFTMPDAESNAVNITYGGRF